MRPRRQQVHQTLLDFLELQLQRQSRRFPWKFATVHRSGLDGGVFDDFRQVRRAPGAKPDSGASPQLLRDAPQHNPGGAFDLFERHANDAHQQQRIDLGLAVQIPCAQCSAPG